MQERCSSSTALHSRRRAKSWGLNGHSYKAHYKGDDTYNASFGPCEPLNALKGTLTVEKDFVNAPEDATVTLQIRQGEEVEESAQRGDGGSISKVLAPGTCTAEELERRGRGEPRALQLVDRVRRERRGRRGRRPVYSGHLDCVNLRNGADITCRITNRHVLPLISVSKTPNPSVLQEPGGNVTYTIIVTNTWYGSIRSRSRASSTTSSGTSPQSAASRVQRGLAPLATGRPSRARSPEA